MGKPDACVRLAQYFASEGTARRHLPPVLATSRDNLAMSIARSVWVGTDAGINDGCCCAAATGTGRRRRLSTNAVPARRFSGRNLQQLWSVTEL